MLGAQAKGNWVTQRQEAGCFDCTFNLIIGFCLLSFLFHGRHVNSAFWGSVVVLSTWHKPGHIWEEISLKEMLPTAWSMGVSGGHLLGLLIEKGPNHYGLYHPWADGPGLSFSSCLQVHAPTHLHDALCRRRVRQGNAFLLELLVLITFVMFLAK